MEIHCLKETLVLKHVIEVHVKLEITNHILILQIHKTSYANL